MFFRMVVALGLALSSLLLANAAPAQWITLPQKVLTVPIGGQDVAIGIVPRARLNTDAGGQTVLELHVTAGLADIQAKLPAILARFAEEQSSCKWRWTFPRLDPVRAADGFLTLAGEIRIVAWICEDIIKTKLGQETISFSMRVSVAVENNAAKLIPELIDFDLGKSLLKDAGADGVVRAFVAKAVGDLASGDKLTFGFPKEVQDLNPVLDFVTIGNQGDPSSGTLTAMAHAPGSYELLKKIWKLIGGN